MVARGWQVLGELDGLRSLSLADCDLDDDAAEELLEGLAEAPQLRQLDVRWNRLGKDHTAGRGLSADARVHAGSQREKSAAARQRERAGAAAASGKKVYRPKWTRK